ncbi:MAG: LodA/GoxA family CTQ-dependent oxidase, partial [Kiloniellaceae bacterium]
MAQTPVYRIHPGIGIARVGDSPDDFYLAPEAPGALPTDCDSSGNPRLTADGKQELPVRRFKDAAGRIRRQAARFQIYVYDEESPEGRPLRRGDPVAGGGNHGVLVDVQWRVHLANKKSEWFTFRQLDGEHGYAGGHPRRNADITAPEARQQLIIDPGPQVVNASDRRRACFSRDGNPMYAATFPPKGLLPKDIDTLGELLTDDNGRLLVLGGHGCAGSFQTGPGQPRVDDYANNDGWFDDISDGPVMARLVMYSGEVGRQRFIDVDYPAWVLVGYPRYVPQILDMVTLEDVVEDLAIRELADRTDLYGTSGTFDDPEHIDAGDTGALLHWKAGRLRYNPDYRPWFWRDIWPMLFRPDEFSYLSNVLQQSNFPHNQQPRGNIDPFKLCVPPRRAPQLLQARQGDAIALHVTGVLLSNALEPALMLLDQASGPDGAVVVDGSAIGESLRSLAEAAAKFVKAVCPPGKNEDPRDFARRWKDVISRQEAAPSQDYAKAKAAFLKAADEAKESLSALERKV